MNMYEITIYDEDGRTICIDFKRCWNREEAEQYAEDTRQWLDGSKWEVTDLL